ncbi:MAG: DNA-directed RNA polymerase subunit beta' [Balneolales bacterium]
MPLAKKEPVSKDFKGLRISLSSAENILSRSHGEVLNPETINYRTFKPEKDGLFCEKIFGPVKDWECHCGKYKRIRYKGIICDRCGVEVTRKAVRRERMGHISLCVPVVHIWYFKSLPNKIAYLLGFSSKNLEKIVYYESFVVTNPGIARDMGYKMGDLLTEEEYHDILSQLPEEQYEMEDDDQDKFVVKMGADAIEALLQNIKLDETAYKYREAVKTETSMMRKKKFLKRLQVIESFRAANKNIENRPEWMVMRVIPIIPPELRPLVPLEGGRFATSDLNDLYRRVIIRNNRLKRLIDIKAPDVILRNEKRMLQEAVDSIFDNSRKMNAVRSNNRPLKSLSDMLKGKNGRFRQNLLGKRVDYSGRSVIVVGPDLKMHECGLPKEMAVELYKPFIIRRLIERGYVKTVKSAKKVVDRRDEVVWDVLEHVIDGHPVMLNRAPTLHRLGIQAYQPVLIEDKAIRLHPLSCTAFNADFDGDQMAVHLPLSHDAILEASVLMLGSHNIMSPSNGSPITVPSQDMVLGIYYLTKMGEGGQGEGKTFSNTDEVIIAHDQGKLGLHTKINVRLDTLVDGEQVRDTVKTTTGRVIFNQILPKELGYKNQTLGKKELRLLIGDVFNRVGTVKAAKFLDDMKYLGFETATLGGLSFNLEDIVIPKEKAELISAAQDEVKLILERYENGFITDNERYNQVIDKWTSTTNRVSETLFHALTQDKKGFNPVFMMADSGARGSKEQIRQLGGMRGLMAKPQKSSMASGSEVIESPILSSFLEGLTVLEYFISTHGARKGLADTALKTADAGYLTRRLVDVSQDLIVTEDDCGTLRGIKIQALKDNEEIVESLEDRILGRVSMHDVFDPLSDELLVSSNELITEEIGQKIAETSIEEVEIRSVLTCEASRGVCAKCYGRDLSRGKMVQTGEAVGVIAAQSIGEPGTQLTLRTFHVGGTASRLESESQHKAKFDGKVVFDNVRAVDYSDGEEEYRVVLSRAGEVRLEDDSGKVLSTNNIPYGSELLVEEGDVVPKGVPLCKWDPYNALIFSEINGVSDYKDIMEGITYTDETDSQTGHKEKVITDSKDRTLVPTLSVKDDNGRIRETTLPVGAHVVVDSGEKVQAGQVLAKIPRTSASKSKDITAGLPRITELFEARPPKDPAVVSEIEGIVKMGSRKRGSQEVIVQTKDGTDSKTYLIQLSKHILVQENDYVKTGDPLSDGAIMAQDILNILGPYAVQSYLVNEIQEVYRLQGVKINDKHIEVIVRTMMQKVEITDSGDTLYLEGDKIDRFEVNRTNDSLIGKYVVIDSGDTEITLGTLLDRREIREMNSRLIAEGKKEIESREAEPCISKPILLGITRAALSTESWLSAASFQETTKVLTQAAIEAKEDNLLGLKENVVLGHRVPAGTGLKHYQDIIVGSKADMEDVEPASKVFEALSDKEEAVIEEENVKAGK